MTDLVDVGAPGSSGGVPAPPSRRLELVAAGVAVLLSALVLFSARQIPHQVQTEGLGVRSWPSGIALLALVLSLVWLATSLRGRAPDRGDLQASTRAGFLLVVGLSVLTAVVVLCWWLGLHFGVLAPVLVLGVMLLAGVRRVKPLVLVPVITTAVVWVVFVLLLRVPL